MEQKPEKCRWMNQKLRMRLTSGLAVELKLPDLDIRHRYVQQKNKILNLGLKKSDILSLARNFQDFRLIDGALHKVNAYRSLIDDEKRDILSAIGAKDTEVTICPERILQEVANYFGLSVADITGKSRLKTVAEARQICVYLCRELLGLPLIQLGLIFGGRDHSSILYALNKIKEKKDTNKDTNMVVSRLKKKCLFPES